MPHIGIKRHTPAIRMQRLKKLIIKEKVVFPKPLIMPRRTVLVYKKRTNPGKRENKTTRKRTFEQKDSNPFPGY